MDAALLGKLLGRDQQWHGPCTVILDADATVQTGGTDSIGAGSIKSYAPRMVSGRIAADCVCLLADGQALAMVQQQRTRQSTGEEAVKNTLIVADGAHVVAIEFPDLAPLTGLGLSAPATRPAAGTGSHAKVPRPATGATP
jgi:hypothetical protein